MNFLYLFSQQEDFGPVGRLHAFWSSDPLCSRPGWYAACYCDSNCWESPEVFPFGAGKDSHLEYLRMISCEPPPTLEATRSTIGLSLAVSWRLQRFKRNGKHQSWKSWRWKKGDCHVFWFPFLFFCFGLKGVLCFYFILKLIATFSDLCHQSFHHMCTPRCFILVKVARHFFLSSRSVYQQIVIQPCRGQIVAGPTARQSWTRYTGVTFSIDVEGYDLQETNRAPWVWKKRWLDLWGCEGCRNW